MKKTLLTIIITIGFMIMGMNSLQAQSDSISKWTIETACFHDSQDQHLYDVDIEPFVLTINTASNVITFNNPQRPREYILTGPKNVRRSRNATQFFFDAIDEKFVECEMSVVLYTEGDFMKISISVKYSTMILYWSGITADSWSGIQI